MPTTGPAIEKKKETVDRTDDPVRMYLREMGAVELLSREGEIAIAKRIEAGRDTMILGLCESPITFNAIIDWSTALNEGTMQLREILDLDAMLSKGPTRRAGRGRRGRRRRDQREDRRPIASRKRKSARKRPPADEDEDDDDRASRAAPVGRRGRGQHPQPRADGRAAQADGAREVRQHHRALQEVRARSRPARLDAMGAGGEFSRGRRDASIRSCARSSPPRSRASSSTAPRSNIWSTSSTPSTAA